MSPTLSSPVPEPHDAVNFTDIDGRVMYAPRTAIAEENTRPCSHPDILAAVRRGLDDVYAGRFDDFDM